jgi:hypothetical protein
MVEMHNLTLETPSRVYRNHLQFSPRMSGEGVFADSIRALSKTACRQARLEARKFKSSTDHFRVPGSQSGLFE